MTDKVLNTEIVCIVDRSGSMGGFESDTIGGFNKFLEDQKGVPGKATFTLVLFNHELDTVYDGIDLQDVEPLDGRTYITGGTTALLDALGVTLDRVVARYKNKKKQDRFDKAIFCVITDGKENASVEYANKLASLKKKVKKWRKKGWDFYFLGSANIDAFLGGSVLGIPRTAIDTYDHTKSGVYTSYAMTGASISHSRMGGSADDDSWKNQS